MKKKIAQIRIAFLLLFCSIFSSMLFSKVDRIEIKEQKSITDLPSIKKTGPYEIITGIVYFEVDPENAANLNILDLQYAPRNKEGKIEFSADFELHKPVTPARGNHRLMFIVCNRGRIGNYFSWLKEYNWFYNEGWTILYCGWQCDLRDSYELLNLNSPVISEKEKPITGKVLFEFINYEDNIVFSMPLEQQGSIAYPVVNTESSQNSLTVRQYPWEKPVELPHSEWRFARYENGNPIPNSTAVYIKGGFKPGWIYDLVYEAKNPKVVGLGMAAIRDVVSFFRYEAKDSNNYSNSLFGNIQYAFAYGHSQSARLLNHFVYQDFNEDENKRIVFNGIIANCPGAGKGEFNSRFAQPTRYGSHLEDNLYMIDFFPFTTVEQTDPILGESGNAFKKAKDSGFFPKIIFINSSTDYWTRGASLLHTDVEGKKDFDIDPSVRIYSISSIPHTENRIGIIGRALLVALDKWVSKGILPPDSKIPKISENTLVDLETFLKQFPKVPNIVLPSSFYSPIRLNPGSRWKTIGISDNVPPIESNRFSALIPQVDIDGNEIAGVKLPEVAVPLATYTGWKQRRLSYSNTLSRNAGTSWPFALSKEERLKNNDPRPSILERYPSKDIYLSKLSLYLKELFNEGFLLEDDIPLLMKEADKLRFWD